jgi:tRNA-dihydrouridine synthase B
MLKIGPLNIEQAIVLAPMEDVSNTAFRLICRRLGADIVYTEFTSSEALIRDAIKALKKITVTEAERPIAIQIYGGIEESMEQAAKVVESNRPDFIDINCGCWVKNHALRGEGAGLLRDLNQFEKIVQKMVFIYP